MSLFPRFAHAGYSAIKHQVDEFDRWPAWQKFRRGFKAPIYRIADTGVFGLTPLQMHILICGFPASGTTLLQLMLENALPDARRFGRERSGWRAATYSVRNHAVMISKQPRDLLRLDPLKAFYKTRKARLKIIIMLRDPRDLMTTRRKRDGLETYAYPCQYWKEYYDAFILQQEREETLLVRYEDLVGNAGSQQQAVEGFIDLKMKIPFDQFQSVERSDFDATTLNGIRPLESSRIARWQAPEHHDRIKEILAELPDLPAMVQRLGYAEDDGWTRAYL